MFIFIIGFGIALYLTYRNQTKKRELQTTFAHWDKFFIFDDGEAWDNLATPGLPPYNKKELAQYAQSRNLTLTFEMRPADFTHELTPSFVFRKPEYFVLATEKARLATIEAAKPISVDEAFKIMLLAHETGQQFSYGLLAADMSTPAVTVFQTKLQLSEPATVALRKLSWNAVYLKRAELVGKLYKLNERELAPYFQAWLISLYTENSAK